ncbi:dUTPase [compost metagenome]
MFGEIYEKTLNNRYELQKEFIDIWHFLMDEFIVGGLDSEKLIELYVNKYRAGASPEGFAQIFGAGDILKAIFNTEKTLISNSKHLILPDDEGNIDSVSVLIASNYLTAGGRKVRAAISWKHWKKPSDVIDYDKLHDAYVFTFSSLVKCFILCGMNEDELYNIYVTKNLENVWRQKLGY